MKSDLQGGHGPLEVEDLLLVRGAATLGDDHAVVVVVAAGRAHVVAVVHGAGGGGHGALAVVGLAHLEPEEMAENTAGR